MFDMRLYKRIPFIGVMLALSMLTGIACGTGTDTVTDTTTGADTEAEPCTRTGGLYGNYSGYRLRSLEEEISWAEVIAVVDLVSVDPGVEVRGSMYGDPGVLIGPRDMLPGTELAYYKTLEFTFQVKEYLMGSGDDQVVGTVFGLDCPYDTRLDAVNLALDVDQERITRWDDREAVVFLRGDDNDPRVNWDTGRYELGYESEPDWGGQYSIASELSRRWLPAVSSKTGEQRFLLQSDLQISSPKTITLDELKILISSFEQETAGQTEEYKTCVRYKHQVEREALALKEQMGGSGSFYRREYQDLESGMPSGSKVYTHFFAPVGTEPWGAKYVLAGRDPEYFHGEWPGDILVARPLTQGTYRVNHAYLRPELVPCNATVPEATMERLEVIVNVTAPEGTLHEAFFDPVTVGNAVVADSTNGVLQPAAFTGTNSAPATIRRIAWEDGMVKMAISPHDGITGHTVDFIGMDGSVALSLAVADAAVDEANGTLTWKVEPQPWQSGDKLMLRISAPVS